MCSAGSFPRRDWWSPPRADCQSSTSLQIDYHWIQFPAIKWWGVCWNFTPLASQCAASNERLFAPSRLAWCFADDKSRFAGYILKPDKIVYRIFFLLCNFQFFLHFPQDKFLSLITRWKKFNHYEYERRKVSLTRRRRATHAPSETPRRPFSPDSQPDYVFYPSMFLLVWVLTVL